VRDLIRNNEQQADVKALENAVKPLTHRLTSPNIQATPGGGWDENPRRMTRGAAMLKALWHNC
jgi:hypothetical protein